MINRGLVSQFQRLYLQNLTFSTASLWPADKIRGAWRDDEVKKRKTKKRKERDEEKRQESQWNSSALGRNNPGPMPQTSRSRWKACKRKSGSILVQLAIEIGFVKVQLKTRIGFNCGWRGFYYVSDMLLELEIDGYCCMVSICHGSDSVFLTEVHKAFRFRESRERRTKKAGKPDMAVSDGCVSQSHSRLRERLFRTYSGLFQNNNNTNNIQIISISYHHLN